MSVCVYLSVCMPLCRSVFSRTWKYEMKEDETLDAYSYTAVTVPFAVVK